MYETTVRLVKFSYIRICMCTGFYLGFIVRGEKSRGLKATSFLGGSGGMPLGNFMK